MLRKRAFDGIMSGPGAFIAAVGVVAFVGCAPSPAEPGAGREGGAGGEAVVSGAGDPAEPRWDVFTSEALGVALEVPADWGLDDLGQTLVLAPRAPAPDQMAVVVASFPPGAANAQAMLARTGLHAAEPRGTAQPWSGRTASGEMRTFFVAEPVTTIRSLQLEGLPDLIVASVQRGDRSEEREVLDRILNTLAPANP